MFVFQMTALITFDNAEAQPEHCQRGSQLLLSS
jgi:hypothetical protein